MAEGLAPRSLLVELKAVEPGYPLVGELRLDPDRPLGSLLAADTIVAHPDLLRRLGVAVGEEVSLGGARFRIAGTVVSEADRLAGSFRIGPRVFVSREGLARTTLAGFGSRVTRPRPPELPRRDRRRAAARRTAAALKARLEGVPGIRVESWLDGQPELREAIRRTSRFLGLVALTSLLVGGVGVAQTVRAWIASRLDALAILRCLGVTSKRGDPPLRGRRRRASASSGASSAPLPGIGLVAGVGRRVRRPPARREGSTRGSRRRSCAGLGLGLGVSLLFGVPALFAVRPGSAGARPAQGRRADPGLATAAAPRRGAPPRRRRRDRRGSSRACRASPLLFTAGLAASALVLALAARGLLWLVTHVPRERLPFALRHGLAALVSPGAGTVSSILALGLGTLVVLHIALVQRDFSRQLAADLPANAPTAFLLDVQPDQWPGVEARLSAEGATRIVSVPVVTARLTAIDGTRHRRPRRPGEGRRPPPALGPDARAAAHLHDHAPRRQPRSSREPSGPTRPRPR